MKTIMIVDDEPDVLELAKSCLQSEILDVVTASNSRQALERMDNEQTFDLILVNTPMPCSNKTALFSIQPKSKFEAGDVSNFLEKPFTKEQLLHFVNQKIGSS